MAKDQGVKAPAARKARAPAKAASAKAPTLAAQTAAAPAAAPKKRTSPAQFWREVRVEARKVTWTSWSETWITSVMVLIMVVLTALFFMAVDSALSFLMQQLLNFAGGGGHP